MTGFFADLSYAVVIAVGVFAICGFLALAAWTSPKALRHPDGRKGRVRDDLIVLSPMLPFLVLVAVGAFQPVLRDEAWWTGALVAVCVCGLAAHLLPAVRRARRRVDSLNRYPPQ